jgi:hypothetical protein
MLLFAGRYSCVLTLSNDCDCGIPFQKLHLKSADVDRLSFSSERILTCLIDSDHTQISLILKYSHLQNVLVFIGSDPNSHFSKRPAQYSTVLYCKLL